MKARRLNERVSILGVKNVKNAEGKVTKVETELGTIYCEHLKSSIKEFKENGINGRKNSLNLLIRYQQRFDIKSEMSIKFKGHKYVIKNIEPNHAEKDYTLIGCEFYE